MTIKVYDLFALHFREAMATQVTILRLDSGLSRQELADKFNYSYGKMTCKETARSSITSQDLALYAKEFSIFPSDIISLAEQSILNRR